MNINDYGFVRVAAASPKLKVADCDYNISQIKQLIDEAVKQNIKNKFQEHKLPMVDEVIALDAESRKAKQEADDLRASRNKISKQIGALMAQGKKEEAEEIKKQVTANSERLAALEEKEEQLQEQIKAAIEGKGAPTAA